MKALNLRKIILILPLLILAGAGLTGCKKEVAAARQEARNVKVKSVSRASIQVNTEYASKLKPSQEILVTSKSPGKVATVKVDVGQEVKAGDILLTLDTKEVNAQYNQSKAALKSAQSNLARTKDSLYAQQLSQAQTAQKGAQLKYDGKKKIYDATQGLYNAGKASKADLDTAKFDLDAAQIELDAANDSINILQNKAIPQAVDAAETQVEQAQAAVDLVSTQVDNMTLLSPAAGTIAMRNVDEGELLSNTMPAFSIINNKVLAAEVSVSDNMVVKLKKGQEVSVIINSLNDKEIKGKIDNISPTPDVRTQLYTVKINIDNSAGEVLPGMFARVEFPSKAKDNVLVVSNDCIITENGVQYVYLASNGKVKKATVTTGISDGKVTEITGGVQEGDKVIIEGQTFLSDGDEVNIGG